MNVETPKEEKALNVGVGDIFVDTKGEAYILMLSNPTNMSTYCWFTMMGTGRVWCSTGGLKNQIQRIKDSVNKGEGKVYSTFEWKLKLVRETVIDAF